MQDPRFELVAKVLPNGNTFQSLTMPMGSTLDITARGQRSAHSLSRDRIVVIADDISGAAELAGIACARGLTAEVHTRFDPTSTAEVIAVDTDTRGLTASEAAAKVHETTHQVRAALPGWIYKKTDSVLRGHVRVELTAIFEAAIKDRVLFIPANPGRGRVIRGGQYFIHNQPLNRTVFATDPDYPATTSDVRELVCREPGAEVHLLGRDSPLPAKGLCVPEVTETSDLRRRAEFAARDETTLCAGAVEFFAALLEARHDGCTTAVRIIPRTRGKTATLVVCGSAAAWPDRYQQCRASDTEVFVLPEDALAQVSEAPSSDSPLAKIATAAGNALTAKGCALLAIGNFALPPSLTPGVLTQVLAETVAIVFQRTCVDRIFLEGGATAAAVLRRMNWNHLEAAGHFAPDLAAFEVKGQTGLLLGIKPGSYSWPENTWPPICMDQ